jgi:hypothetical protein
MQKVFGIDQFAVVSSEISSDLLAPLTVGIRSDATDNDFASFMLDEKENVMSNQIEWSQNFHREEIGGPHNIQMAFQNFVFSLEIIAFIL